MSNHPQNSELRNCPIEFYNNCQKAGSKCGKCSAGFGEETMKLFYVPINTELSPHPYEKIHKSAKGKSANKRVRSVKSKQVRKGFQNERTQINKIVKATQRSGAKFGDGDFTLLDGLIRGDVKTRFTRSSFTLTQAEYQEGRASGVSVWAITVNQVQLAKKSATTVYVLTEDTFHGLLDLAKRGLENLEG